MIQGVYTALITPFNDSLQLDEVGLAQNIDFQIDQGVDGILVLGTTGESPTLTKSEKTKIIEIAKQKTEKKLALMVGVGTNCTHTTVENAKMAESLGADSLLVVTPYYNKPTQSGLIHHFEKVAMNVSLPIILYNIQGRCGQNIETRTLKQLSDIPNIVGVKEASGNLSQIMDVINLKLENFSILSGDDALTLPIMALGGHGVISVASNLIAKQMKKLVSLCDQDIRSARALHHVLFPLFKALFIETNPIPIKAALNHIKSPAGNCRLPLCKLEDENLNKLKLLLDDLTWLQETKTLSL